MINKLIYKVIVLVLLLLTQIVYPAEVYQWTDIKGRQHYSDKKHENATTYKLAENYSYYKVRKVYDGDTILLADGRKIRLLGINTPEIEHANQATQVGGDAARKWLTKQLLGAKIRLEFDQQKRDKYKRHLAHIFTEQGTHINYELVRLGFASTNIFPPNLKYVPQLLAAERIAESERLGIWGYLDYQIKLTGELNKINKQGWQRIVGNVTGIKNTRKSIYLELTHNFHVRIKKEYLKYFADMEYFMGKKIEVRGWVNKYNNGFSMLIKHPGAIKIMD